VDDLDVLPNDDIAKYGEKGEDSWECGLSIYDEEGDIVNLETIGEVAHAVAGLIRVGYYYYFMAAVPEFLEGTSKLDVEKDAGAAVKGSDSSQLIDVTLDPTCGEREKASVRLESMSTPGTDIRIPGCG